MADLSHCLTVQQAADRLGLTAETIRQYARPYRDARGLPRLRSVAGIRVLRFEPDEIARFSDRNPPGRPKSFPA